MTRSDVLTKATASLDRMVSDELERNEILLTDRGATDEEITVFMAHRRATLEQWSRDALEEIRRGLEEPDASTTRLQ